MKIIIEGELPDLNTIIAESKKGRRGYQPYAIMKREYTDLVTWKAKSIKKKYKKIDLKINWICKNRRKDKDNIAAGVKFILDGLVNAGVIKNDGWKEIGDITHTFDVDKLKPRIEIEIMEVE